MNVELSNGTVASFIGAAIFAVLTAILGKPVAEAWRNRRKSEENAGALEAEAVGAAAELDANQYRKADAAIDRWAARAERAEIALDKALVEKRQVAESAAAAIEKIRTEARDDVHKNANWAMEQVKTVKDQAQAEIERIQHAAEARILAVEAQHRADMGALHDRVLAGEEQIAHLTECNTRCEEDGRQLRGEIAELKAWQDRSDVMGGTSR